MKQTEWPSIEEPTNNHLFGQYLDNSNNYRKWSKIVNVLPLFKGIDTFVLFMTSLGHNLNNTISQSRHKKTTTKSMNEALIISNCSGLIIQYKIEPECWVFFSYWIIYNSINKEKPQTTTFCERKKKLRSSLQPLQAHDESSLANAQLLKTNYKTLLSLINYINSPKIVNLWWAVQYHELFYL